MSKKGKYFTKVEEKYVFNISRIFWHIFIGLGILGIIGGILLLLWGIVPPIKHSVRKPKYPPPIAVTMEELQTKVSPTKIKKEKIKPNPIKEIIKPREKKYKEIKEVSPEEKEYLSSLNLLKGLIPPKKYLWKSRGHWYYPYGRRYWEYYKTSGYRKWVVDRLGISDRLKSAYRKAKATDFISKKHLLDAYISILSSFPQEKRVEALKALITYTKGSVSQSISNVKLLEKCIPNFFTKRVDYLTKLAKFGSRNPQDGATFIEYINENIIKFDPGVRIDVLDAMISAYYKYFNNVSRQKEVTNLALSQIVGFAPQYQAKALAYYYSIYYNKNAERERRIKQIDWKYKQSLSAIESRYHSDKLKKVRWRIKGLYGIGGGIVLIAVIALLLVLLSIQRHLKNIEEKIAKGSESGQN